MTHEDASHQEFLAGLAQLQFEPGDVIDVPDLSLLDPVAVRMRGHILSAYSDDDKRIAETKPLGLEDKFRERRPINFVGTLENPRVTIQPHNDALLTRLPDSGTIDYNTLVQFKVGADAQTEQGDVIGDYTMQFFMLARLLDQGPVVSLFSARKAYGTVFQAVPGRKPEPLLDVSGVMPTSLHGGRSGTRPRRRR